AMNLPRGGKMRGDPLLVLITFTTFLTGSIIFILLLRSALGKGREGRNRPGKTLGTPNPSYTTPRPPTSLDRARQLKAKWDYHRPP
ncbi:MAG: hypothetical protein ACYTFG_12770, partial [Planctomycetota bacterium]